MCDFLTRERLAEMLPEAATLPVEIHYFPPLRAINVVIKGLKGRCKAMVECGWKWGEMGKEGTRALEGLNMNGYREFYS